MKESVAYVLEFMFTLAKMQKKKQYYNVKKSSKSEAGAF